jgi:hypothetical protein
LKKIEEKFTTQKEEIDALKMKKEEKMHHVKSNREHNLKYREQELKKTEKIVNERLQKIA